MTLYVMGVRIADNLHIVRRRILSACQRCERSPDSVHLIAVTKNQPLKKIAEAFHEGHRDFGDNYVQELKEHQQSLCDPSIPLQPIRWHFIGQLQRNKVKYLIGHVVLIHSLDSIGLANEIHNRAQAKNIVQPALLQINLASEETKGGLQENEIPPFLHQCNSLDHLLLKGLMALPPFHEDPEKTRPYFHHLREIMDEINEKKMYKEPLKGLSMGMSHDFEVAIEEGATWLRVGTDIFGERAL